MKRKRAKGVHVKVVPRGKYTLKQIEEAWEILTEMAGGENWHSVLTPESVLEAVLANRSHPFRQYLERDVKKAARQHWIAQIGQLMNEVRISVTITQSPGHTVNMQTRALVWMPKTTTSKSGRRPLHQIRRTQDDREAFARVRAQYLRSWVGATEAQLAVVGQSIGQTALASLLSDVKRALVRFDTALRDGLVDAAE